MSTEKRAEPTRSADPSAWLAQHGDAMFRYALLRLGNRDAAEDMVQETLLAALKAYERFSGRSSERTWLIAILKRKVADHLRKSSRESAEADLKSSDAFVSEHFTERGKWKADPAKWKRDPNRAFEQQEFWDVFTRCLSGLPPRLSSAFVLREMDELSTDNICKLLGATATNLWTLLHRARTRLRECLEINWFSAKS